MQTDVVIFLAEEELVEPLMAAIQKAGRLDEHGTGVVFVLAGRAGRRHQGGDRPPRTEVTPRKIAQASFVRSFFDLPRPDIDIEV